MFDNNKNKLIVELEEQFSRHRSERAGQKRFFYPDELKDQARAAIDQDMSFDEVAKACGVTCWTVRNWVIGKDRPQVKRLELDTTPDLDPESATIRISDRIVVQMPASVFVRELLSIEGH